MRDIVITLIVFGSIPLILKRPYIGTLLWVWISVMNPHRLSWGFAYSFPFAAIIACVTLLALVITQDPKKLPSSGVINVLMLFSIWISISTIFSFFPDASVTMWQRVIKILLMTFVTAMLLKTKEQVQLFIWTLVCSLGFYGVKGGIFTVATGGSSRVWGPEGSFIEGNNEVALALIIIIPLMYYLYLQAKKPLVRYGLIASMVLCFLASLGSYSRGALLAALAMAVYLWMRSPKKAAMGVLMILMIPAAIAFMPKQWTERMDTINTYQQDSSAMGRINAWHMTFNLAMDRPLVGGGFQIYEKSLFERYAPNPLDIHAAHSIYFQALGEHGFVGLGLYLLMALLTWRRGSWIIRNTRGREDLKWAGDLATMIQVSMAGFAVGGAFLSLLYFDVPYYLVAAMVVVGHIVEQALKAGPAPAEQKLPGTARTALAGNAV